MTNPFTIGVATVTTEIEITSEPQEKLTAANPVNEEFVFRYQSPVYVDLYTVDIDSNPNQSRLPIMIDEQVLLRNSQDAFRGYTWCSFLFCLALIVTWVSLLLTSDKRDIPDRIQVPSGIGSVYYVAHPDEFVFGLHWITTFTLSLQGFWNAFIYAAPSLPALRILFGSASSGSSSKRNRRGRLSYRNIDEAKLSQPSRTSEK